MWHSWISCRNGLALVGLLIWNGAVGQKAFSAQDHQAFLQGVKEVRIDPGAVAGPLCVVGEKVFPVLLGKSGSGFQPVVAAGQWGSGRVVAFGHTDAFFTEKALAAADTQRFLLNCLQWAGGTASPLHVAVHKMPALANWLRHDQQVRRRQIQVLDGQHLNPELFSQTHVLILNSHDLSEATLSSVSDFVQKGGGLLVGGLGWGWLQLHPGKTLRTDFPGNLLLGQAGILWADGYLERSGREGFTNPTTLGREYHGLEAARLLASVRKHRDAVSDSVLEQAFQTVGLALTVIPNEHPIRRLLSSGQSEPTPVVIPTPQTPIRRSDKMAAGMLQIQVREALEADPNATKAHPAAAIFPGAVPPGARTVRKEVPIDPTIPGWQSTGLYAMAGRPITVKFDSPEVIGQVFIQIGCHTDRLWHLEEWKRVPELVKRIQVQSLEMTAASPFGGLIYLGMLQPRSNPGRITCQIDGAVEAPMYVHGQTTLRDWPRIRLRPAPWAELVSKRIILTLPSSYVRNLNNPSEVMDFWTAVIEACDRLAGGPARTDAQRIVCDLQISAGYMHAGYPIMTHLDIAPVLVDVGRLRSNAHGGVWGLFHEIGHNYQSPDWTFQGAGEVTNNLFTVYVFDHLCRVPREKSHPALATQERLKRRQRYFAAGAPFDQWQADPFLALDMYLQLQEAFGWKPFEKTFAEYRALKPEERPRTDSEKRDQWCIRFSRAVGRDLSGFFRQWGIPLSARVARSLQDLPRWPTAR